MVSGKRMIRRLSALLLSATLALSACEKSAKEKLSEAYSAIQSKDADRAEAAIKDALAKEPDAEQAPVLMAQVHRLRAQYEKAEQELDGAWKKNSLDGDKLSTQQKRMKQLFTEEYYPELYREWAESIDAVANPQKFEEIVLKGLKHEKDDKYLNTMLVEFYGKYAEKLIEQGKKAQGADTLEKIKPLYTSSKIRNEALTRASALRLEVYREGAQARFDTSIKPKLVEAYWRHLVSEGSEGDEYQRRWLRVGGLTDAEQARAFVGAVSGTPVPVGCLQEALRSGELLCDKSNYEKFGNCSSRRTSSTARTGRCVFH